jgi:amino acid transporter
MLLAQGLIGSTISLLFIVEPSVSSMFWLLSAMLVQLYLLMYAMMFAAALKLRRTRPEVERPFRIPGGHLGVEVACGVGIVFSAAAFAVGFVPPSGLPETSVVSHTLILVVGVVSSVVVPLGISRWSHRRAAGEPETVAG